MIDRRPSPFRPAARAFATLALLTAVAVASGPADAGASKSRTITIASSTFDEGADGWTIFGEAEGPTHHADGGRPGGHVTATDPPSTSGTSYWRAPAKFLGDVSAAYGSKLTFDLRDEGPGSTFRDPDVVLGSGALVLEYRQKRAPKSKRFTRFTVKLARKKSWTDASTGLRATAEQMQAVLGSLDTLLIRGEFRNGPETFALDNVTLRGRAE